MSAGNSASGTRLGLIAMAMPAAAPDNAMPAKDDRQASRSDAVQNTAAGTSLIGQSIMNSTVGLLGHQQRGDRAHRAARHAHADAVREDHEQRAADRVHQVRAAAAGDDCEQRHQERQAGGIRRHERVVR